MLKKLHENASLHTLVAMMAADTPVSPAPGNGQDPTPPAAPNRHDRRASKAKAAKAAKAKPAAETTLDRAESLPEEVEPAPKTPPSQDAPSLDELLASAAAPEDEDVDLSMEDLGPPIYGPLTRRTAPPQMVPFRILPREYGYKTIYMLRLKREAQMDGDLDTHPLVDTVRKGLMHHPTFQKGVKRFEVRLGVTSLAKPFFFEINLDDSGVYGMTRRDVVAKAEKEWVICTSDRSTGYTGHGADVEGDPDPVIPTQTFDELYTLAYAAPLIKSTDHPLIRRGALRRAAPKPASKK
jgi:hypothetical protein